MATSDATTLQDGDLGDSIVTELERIVRRLGGGAGQWTLETVFSNGYFVRGFIKHGPINREDMRDLGRAG